MFSMFGVAAGASHRPVSAVAAVFIALAAVTTAVSIGAHAQQAMTEQQMIDQLLGKTSRGVPGSPGAAAPAAPRTLSQSETDRLRALLDKAGTRAFSAKERTQVAAAVQNRPSLDFEIYFPFNSSALQESAMETMERIGKLLTNPTFADRGFLIAGHTDAKGKPGPNQVVSQRRAEAVKAYLVKTYKIDPARLRVIGYGKEQLKDTRQPFASINRRVQIINLPDGTLTASR